MLDFFLSLVGYSRVFPYSSKDVGVKTLHEITGHTMSPKHRFTHCNCESLKFEDLPADWTVPKLLKEAGMTEKQLRGLIQEMNDELQVPWCRFLTFSSLFGCIPFFLSWHVMSYSHNCKRVVRQWNKSQKLPESVIAVFETEWKVAPVRSVEAYLEEENIPVLHFYVKLLELKPIDQEEVKAFVRESLQEQVGVSISGVKLRKAYKKWFERWVTKKKFPRVSALEDIMAKTFKVSNGRWINVAFLK